MIAVVATMLVGCKTENANNTETTAAEPAVNIEQVQADIDGMLNNPEITADSLENYVKAQYETLNADPEANKTLLQKLGEFIETKADALKTKLGDKYDAFKTAVTTLAPVAAATTAAGEVADKAADAVENVQNAADKAADAVETAKDVANNAGDVAAAAATGAADAAKQAATDAAKQAASNAVDKAADKAKSALGVK